MSYRELQQALKGHTTVKLNSKASVLQAEYDRLFLDGATCELPSYSESMFSDDEPINNDDVIITVPVATQQSQRPVANLINDQAGGNFYQRPVLKGKVNAQKVSEVKRQASQAPRHTTPVNDKYSNKKAVNDIRQQQIKGSPNKVSCKFNSKHDEFFVNTNHKRYIETLGSTERQALSNITSFTKAVVNVVKGFHSRQVERNAA